MKSITVRDLKELLKDVPGDFKIQIPDDCWIEEANSCYVDNKGKTVTLNRI